MSDAALPEGVMAVRVGAGANCSSAGSAVDLLFYTSVVAGAVFVALSAAFPAKVEREREDRGSSEEKGSTNEP